MLGMQFCEAAWSNLINSRRSLSDQLNSNPLQRGVSHCALFFNVFAGRCHGLMSQHQPWEHSQTDTHAHTHSHTCTHTDWFHTDWFHTLNLFPDAGGKTNNYRVLQQFLSEKWMAIYPYNIFYSIDLDQSVSKGWNQKYGENRYP